VALLDVMVGGIMLGVGLAIIMSVTSRALSRQTDGEKRLVAAWLADELLNMVLMETPKEYPHQQDTSGRFKAPFEDFAFEVDIEDQGLGMPYQVTAIIRWPARRPINEIAVQGLISQPKGEQPPREPLEPIDRDARYFDEEYGEQDDEG
jgi:hypothetical protein